MIGDNIMLAVPVSQTFEDNMKLKLYSDGKKKEYDYIGLYKDKSIRAIGKLTKVVRLERKSNEYYYDIIATENENYVTEDEKNRISKMMDRYPGDYDKCKFFFVDDFYEIDYKNEGTQGIVGGKKFFLDNLLPATTKEIAYQLDGQTWKLEKGKDIIVQPPPPEL